ncbi:Gfo/Idh/MocA family oxidoreductase [Streptomyces puniciscabiei]
MSSVSVGVVGAGTMGADHVHTPDHWVSGAQVVSVADVDEERAARVAAVAGAPATGDGHALIADPAAARGRAHRRGAGVLGGIARAQAFHARHGRRPVGSRRPGTLGRDYIRLRVTVRL